MFNSNESMSLYTRRHDFQKPKSIAGRTPVYANAQCRTVAIKESDQVEEPFPIKPVFHRRLPRIHIPLGLQNFEKITLSTQQRGHMMPQDHHSGGNRDTRFLHSKLPSGELHVTRAIQAKEQLLQEKLWTVGEKIKSIQINSSDTAAGYEHMRREDYIRQAEWGEVHTKPRISGYQRRELLKNGGLLFDGRFDDLKQLREKQSTEDRFKNKYDAQQAKWEVSEYKTGKVPNTLGVQNVNENFRRKKEEKINGVREEMNTRYRQQNEASLENTTWTREKKYKDRTHKNTNSSNDEQNMNSLQKSRLASEYQSTGGNLYEEHTLPPLSLNSRQQQQPGPEFTNAGDKIQHLPCKICHRTFQSETRLEKHTQICTKINLKQRQVFNSCTQRFKGSQIEEYLKTHSRSKTPEVLIEKRRNNIRKRH